MAWNLTGRLIENCSCNMFCPCWFGVQEVMVMDRGWCAGLIALSIDEGDADGVDLSGRTAVLAVHFPGPTIFDGGGTARVFVDDGAADEQRERLEEILHGKQGGPMEMVGNFLSSWLPTESASIDVTEDGDRVQVSVDGKGKLDSNALRDPDGNGFALRGGGFVGGLGLQEAELAAPSDGRWADPEMPEQYESKSGARGAFAWAG